MSRPNTSLPWTRDNHEHRRSFLHNLVIIPTFELVLLIENAQPVVAKSDDSDTNVSLTIYKSGKSPIIAGASPKNKNDLSGTRKDPNFLRSIADCKVNF